MPHPTKAQVAEALAKARASSEAYEAEQAGWSESEFQDWPEWEDRPQWDEPPKNNGGDQSAKFRFPLRHFDDIQPETTAPYLVRDIIPRKGLVLFWGPPKCGKTFSVLDLVMHIALGRDYRGKRVKQGAVVYCSFEGGMGINRRVAAFKQNCLDGYDGSMPFWLMSGSISLAKDRKALIVDIRKQVGETIPSCVVIDTLNRSLAGSESSDEDMALYIQAADAIAEAFGCTVIIVHHCGVNGERPRGHTSLTGAIDSQIACRKNGDISEIEIEFMKDGEAGLVLQFSLKVVEVAVDDDGEALTSCIVVPVEGQASLKAKPKAKMTKAAKIALDALTEALVEVGKLPDNPSGIPNNTKVVTIKSWRFFAYGRGISVGGGGDEDLDRKAREKAFLRASEWLIAEHLVGVKNQDVWRV